MNKRVVVVGGYGVFGGFLSRRLIATPGFDVIVAGRSITKAHAFCDTFGGTPEFLDLNGEDLAQRIGALSPDIVIDTAGPYQAYRKRPYRLAQAAILFGAHYLDLSDDADFSRSIDLLNDQAIERGVSVISGASSVPGLSSAAVETLKDGLDRIILIESSILPGNRAPRGVSVVRSILRQAGQPIPHQIAGRMRELTGWSAPRREEVSVSGAAPVRRWSSPIGAPDLILFPEYFNASSVRFRAGIELGVQHWGLWLLSLPVRWGVLKTIEPLVRPVRALANLLYPFGSDRGAMVVRVLGVKSDGQHEVRTWKLIVEAGDGPNIPALPAQILCKKIAEGTLEPGARPCISAFPLSDFEETASDLALKTETTTEPISPLFQDALAENFDLLPSRVKELHQTCDITFWEGRAEVTTTRSPFAWLIRKMIGFPGASGDITAKVNIERIGDYEIWRRCFGGRKFHSRISVHEQDGSSEIIEQFGLFKFVVGLNADETGLGFPVLRGWFLGIPIPRFLLPSSTSYETVRDDRFHFDIEISIPVFGRIVRYKGYLHRLG